MIDHVLKILCFVGGIVLVFSLFLKTSNFLDIRSIILEHYKIMQGNYLQAFSIYIIPLIFAITISRSQCIRQDILDNLNIILSILISMFFAVLSILCSMDIKTKNKKYQLLFTETFTSTVFEIIICLLLLFTSFSLLFIGKYPNNLLLQVISSFIYYLTMIVILNIFIIIKRVKIIFDYK